jgi:hypothetical protein
MSANKLAMGSAAANKTMYPNWTTSSISACSIARPVRFGGGGGGGAAGQDSSVATRNAPLRFRIRLSLVFIRVKIGFTHRHQGSRTYSRQSLPAARACSPAQSVASAGPSLSLHSSSCPVRDAPLFFNSSPCEGPRKQPTGHALRCRRSISSSGTTNSISTLRQVSARNKLCEGTNIRINCN